MRTVLAEGAQAETQPDAVEMPGPWETWKTKVRFPTFPPRRRRSPHQVNNWTGRRGLPEDPPAGYKSGVLGRPPMAGLEVTPYGRF
jgi:hypothetical protein